MIYYTFKKFKNQDYKQKSKFNKKSPNFRKKGF